MGLLEGFICKKIMVGKYNDLNHISLNITLIQMKEKNVFEKVFEEMKLKSAF